VPDAPYRDDDPTRQMRRPAPLRSPLTGRPTVPGLGAAGSRTAPEVDETRVMPRPPQRTAPPAGGPPRTAAAARPTAGGGTRPPQRPPVAPRRPAGPPPRRRRRRPGAGLVVLLLVALLLAYPLSLGWVAWSSIDKVEAISSTTSTPGTTFLLVGSDSRAGLTDEQVGELATGTEAEAGGQRTDTILLLHVPSGGGPSVLVSLPRDSFVAIPGNGENKLNAAFAFGGPQLLVETVEGETGLGVDSYVETGFAGFASVVDALGGVDVCLEAPLSDPAAGIDLPAGCQQLTGPQALGFVRSRQTDATGDLARVQRQRQLLGGIVDETLDPALLLNPPRAYRTAGAGGGGLVVDEGTGPLDLGRFLLGMRSVSGPDGVQLTVPVSNPNLSTSAGSAVEWDAERSEQLFAALRADDTEQVRALVAQWTAEAEG
jgi:LCP family protein required for cell wall assembly